MISIATLAEQLAVSPDDVLEVAPPIVRILGLLTDEESDDVRAVLDPDGVRVAW